jgi:hypothetical protein
MQHAWYLARRETWATASLLLCLLRFSLRYSIYVLIHFLVIDPSILVSCKVSSGVKKGEKWLGKYMKRSGCALVSYISISSGEVEEDTTNLSGQSASQLGFETATSEIKFRRVTACPPRYCRIPIIILWHVDALLGNNRDINKYTTAVTE